MAERGRGTAAVERWTRHHRWHLAIAAVIVALRFRFLFTPITSDEGGYMSVARYWSRGATLYREAWVDRPQGLLVLFRGLHMVGLSSPVGVRLLALAAGLLGAFACASIAATLTSRRAYLPTALVAGVLLSVPQYEGFIANAELLSGAIGAAGLALVVRAMWGDRRAPGWHLGAAGAVSGFALLTKQSAFDTVAIAGVLLLVHAVSRVPGSISRLIAYVGGVVAMVALAALHGALTGWSRWWFAVAGYRLGHRSVLETADWSKFRETFGIVAPITFPALLVGGAVVVLCWRRMPWRAVGAVAGWMVFSALAFLAGGLFHRHYWVLLMFPVGTLLGLVAGLPRRPEWRSIATAVLVIVPLAYTFSAIRLPRSEVGPKLSGDGRFTADEAVARWVRAHRTDRSQQVYAMCASAGLYGNIDSNAPYPYLWFLNIQDIPGAKQQLADLLASGNGPTFVAVYQSPDVCDRSGAVSAALRTNYLRVDTVERVQIFQHR